MARVEHHAEIELKLCGDAKGFAALRRDLESQMFMPAITERPWRVQTYYDTPAMDMFTHDLELRVRAATTGYRRTLKRLISLSAEGVFERDELQLDQDSSVPTLKGIKKYLPASVAKDKTGTALHPLMRTEFRRSSFDVTHKGAHIECAIDEGQVVFLGLEGELVRPFMMLELEVKSGAADAIIDLSKIVQKAYGFAPMFLSKPEQAVLLGYEAGAISDKSVAKTVARKIKKRLG